MSMGKGGQPRVLLVEDEPAQRTVLAYNLEAEGFAVTQADNGEDAMVLVDEEEPDIIILDWMMPKVSGIEVCRRLKMRPETRGIPVIMLSARAEEVDRVRGLETGADDYVVKPFGTRELIARIRAVARRTMPEEAPERQRDLGPLTIDVAAHRAAMDGVELELTPKEFDLLAYLSSDLGVVHRRRDILESVWDEHWYGPSKTLDVHVAALRRKLGDPAWIETVRGVGYRFGVPG